MQWGVQWTPKEEAIAEAKGNDGYFTLLSNDIKDPLKALATYRNKDLVEKAFVVEFIALIILSYIKKQM